MKYTFVNVNINLLTNSLQWWKSPNSAHGKIAELHWILIKFRKQFTLCLTFHSKRFNTFTEFLPSIIMVLYQTHFLYLLLFYLSDFSRKFPSKTFAPDCKDCQSDSISKDSNNLLPWANKYTCDNLNQYMTLFLQIHSKYNYSDRHFIK